MHGVGATQQRVVDLGQPEMADFALGHEFGHRADRLLISTSCGGRCR